MMLTIMSRHTYSAPCSPKGISAGSRVWDKAIFLTWPLPTRSETQASCFMQHTYIYIYKAKENAKRGTKGIYCPSKSLAIHHQGVAIGLHGSVILSVDGVLQRKINKAPTVSENSSLGQKTYLFTVVIKSVFDIGHSLSD